MIWSFLPQILATVRWASQSLNSSRLLDVGAGAGAAMSWTCSHFVHSAKDIGTLEIMDKFYPCNMPGWKHLQLFWKLLSHGLLLSNVMFLSHLNIASKCNVVQSSKTQQQSEINKYTAIVFCDSSTLLSFGYDYSCGNLFFWILTNTVCFTWKLFNALANDGFELSIVSSIFFLFAEIDKYYTGTS